jgi:hypothetical protein
VKTYDSDFQGSKLTWKSNPTKASYVRDGDLVFFQITVNLNSVTAFGNGNYQLLLPFKPATNFVFRDGYIFDSSKNTLNPVSAYAGQTTQWAELYYSTSSLDSLVTENQPVRLDTESFIYISGTYTLSRD